MPPDFEAAYRAVTTRDGRFDGQFVTAVRSTGIYCRPACPARTPHRRNVTFYPTAAAAQAAGYRACRRCLPDAAPGSPEWNLRADTVGAAMRLIGDGVIDREGVSGLAGRLGYSERHLSRMLLAELGVGPLGLARARRADIARVLLINTALPIADIAFAAGFSSVRQFNDTIREVYAADPSTLRAARAAPQSVAGALTLKLPLRPPLNGTALLQFLAARAVPGVEVVRGRSYARSLRLPQGAGTAVLTFPPDSDAAGAAIRGPVTVTATLRLAHMSDLAPAVERCRRLLDADADPVGIGAVLGSDPALSAAVRAAPGLRLPGAVDGPEILIRALVGQQVSVAAARTALGRLAAATGELIAPAGRAVASDGAVGMETVISAPANRVTASGRNGHAFVTDSPAPGATSPGRVAGMESVTSVAGGFGDDDPAALGSRLTHLFPSPAALTSLGPDGIGGPRRRATAIVEAARDMADGTLAVHAGRRADELTAELVARPGIGPWTAGYVAMRVLGDPNVLLTGDLALRNGAAALGLAADPAGLLKRAEAWRPFRSYAGMYLWRASAPAPNRSADRPAGPGRRAAPGAERQTPAPDRGGRRSGPIAAADLEARPKSASTHRHERADMTRTANPTVGAEVRGAGPVRALTSATRMSAKAGRADAGAAASGIDLARTCTVDTPVGPFTVVVADVDRGPAVLASGWTGDAGELLGLIAPGIRPSRTERVRSIAGVTDRVIAYHAGDVTAIDDVPVLQQGGEFLRHAWATLRDVPAGSPVSYTELARRAGRPAAVRAAGSACSRNAAALFVPCHRVLPAGGGVGGFRWGASVKRWLLDHEADAA